MKNSIKNREFNVQKKNFNKLSFSKKTTINHPA